VFGEANAELEEIDPFCRHLPEVLPARVTIYHGVKKWGLLALIAKKMAERNPQELGFFDWSGEFKEPRAVCHLLQWREDAAAHWRDNC
jgi:hypothetical protein